MPTPRPATAAPHPSGDKRFKLLEVAMRKHQFRPDALIEVLHAAQELFGYLEPDLLYFVARHLKLPPSRVYGVATFYHFFTLKPKGKHTCVVCTGTACYINGAADILARIRSRLAIKPKETTEDGELSLLTARCLGSCGLAAAAVFDGDVVGRLDQAQFLDRIRKWDHQ